jgi:hypothetical protein
MDISQRDISPKYDEQFVVHVEKSMTLCSVGFVMDKYGQK